MSRVDHNSSVEHEPALNSGAGDFSDRLCDEPALTGPLKAMTDEEAAQHNPWDEPAIVAGDTQAPEGALTYAEWYRRGLERTSLRFSWYIVLGLAVTGGGFAIVGVFFASPRYSGVGWILAVTVVGPVAEEMLKIGATAMTLEVRPYWIRSRTQVMAAVVVGAFIFATIENLLYIHWYIEEASTAIQHWRWQVCTALHVGATTVAGMGLAKAHRESARNLSKLRLELVFPYIVAAVIIHGVYNGLAILFDFSFAGQ